MVGVDMNGHLDSDKIYCDQVYSFGGKLLDFELAYELAILWIHFFWKWEEHYKSGGEKLIILCEEEEV